MLDMDGVITNFVQGMMEHHQIFLNPWPSPESDMLKLFNMNFDQFWAGIDRHFWANLPWMNDTWQIMAIVQKYFLPEDVYIVTSVPSVHGGSDAADMNCAAGKIVWMQRHWPALKDKLVICKDKNFCAASNHVLIDDSEKNVTQFVLHGGRGILLPRPWNRLYHESTIPYLNGVLECLMCA